MLPSPQGKVAAEPPDEVLSRRCTAFTCREYPLVATMLQLRTGRTTSSVSSLTLRSTFSAEVIRSRDTPPTYGGHPMTMDTPSATADTP